MGYDCEVNAAKVAISLASNELAVDRFLGYEQIVNSII